MQVQEHHPFSSCHWLSSHMSISHRKTNCPPFIHVPILTSRQHFYPVPVWYFIPGVALFSLVMAWCDCCYVDTCRAIKLLLHNHHRGMNCINYSSIWREGSHAIFPKDILQQGSILIAIRGEAAKVMLKLAFWLSGSSLFGLSWL